MEVNMDHEAKIMEVWLTKAEKTSLPLVRQQLSPMMKASQANHYLPVFYISGNKSLYPSTSELLKLNLKIN